MVAIVDYGVGNLFSLRSSFAAIGQPVSYTHLDVYKRQQYILQSIGLFLLF